MISSRRKRILKITLPVILSVIVLAILLTIFLIPKGISYKNYFKALNSNYTKQVQYTTLTENSVIVYEKTEILMFDKNNVYHKIEEKVLSSSPSSLYDTITTEYYYTKNKMYYLENNTWKTRDFNVKNSLKKYSLKTEYFETYEFDEKLVNEGSFSGKVLNEHVNTVLQSETGYHTVNIVMIVNPNFKLTNFNITAKTASNRDVVITNTYSYNIESVTLPVV